MRLRFESTMLALVASIAAHGLAGCSVKPIRVIDAGSDGFDERAADGATDVSIADASDEPTQRDADRDVLIDDARVASDGGALLRPSCPDPPNGDRLCNVSRIDAPPSPICLGVASSPSPMLDVAPQLCNVTLGSFYMDRTEVSVRRFALFYAAWQQGMLPAQYDVVYPNGVTIATPRPDLASPMHFNPLDAACTWNNGMPSARDLHPINCISFDVAQYFCAWDGGRLPTRAEYEYVERYWPSAPMSGRLTPWGGSTLTCEHAQLAGCAGANGLMTRHAADGALGAAGDEVFNLVGNVAEWVIDRFDSYDTLATQRCWTTVQLCPVGVGTTRELRGGSYASAPIFSRAVSREPASVAPSPERGFRCVYPVR